MERMAPLSLIPETIVEERSDWAIAVNRNQNLLGKCILVLRRPCTAVLDLQPDEWASLHSELRRLVLALTRLFQPDQFNFAFLMNRDPQVHLHVVPRYCAPRSWAGWQFNDPHWGSAFGDEQQVLAGGELRHLASKIRDELEVDPDP